MAVDLLLRKGRINKMEVRNRFIAGPMEKNICNRDGTVTQRYIDYLVERTRGGAGLMMVESTYVEIRGIGHIYQLGCHEDHVIPALKRMVKAVHAEGGKLALELYVGGRQTPSVISQRQPIAPSVVPCTRYDPIPVPREMTKDDIQEAIAYFAAAARRVLEAGLDMIHIHGAHGYLISSFVSPWANKRTDEYGGSLANRARFPLEILAAMRKVVGPDFPIGYRMSAEEYVEGGLTIKESAEFSKMLAEAGIDLIDISGGIYESWWMIVHGPESPKGGFVRCGGEIKRAVGDKVPVSVAQKLTDPHFANEAMRREGFDFVSLSRGFHADPHYARRVEEGRIDEIIPCTGCHYCTGVLDINVPVGCASNPYTVFENRRWTGKTAPAAKIVVGGGGPGGMSAAKILAEQGNQVTLFEATGALGGQILYSARGAADYGDLSTYLVGQMNKLKVDVRLNSKAGLDIIKELRPDAVVVATGSKPGLDLWPVRGKARQFNIYSAMDRPDQEWNGRCVVIGGDSVSCFVALYIAGRGVEVHVISPEKTFAIDKRSPGKDLLLMSLEALPTVHMRAESTVEEIGEDYVVIQKAGGYERLEEVESTVIGGRVSDYSLYEQIMAELPEQEVYNIGDSVEPRDMYCATHEAMEVAELIRLKHSARTGTAQAARSFAV